MADICESVIPILHIAVLGPPGSGKTSRGPKSAPFFAPHGLRHVWMNVSRSVAQVVSGASGMSCFGVSVSELS